MSDARPNILFVILDSACPSWLSCYEPSVGTSPNIDRVANAGIVFEKAISPSSWTFPVMASVFTGMLPAKHGGHDQHQVLDSAYPTLAEVLGRNGYQTAAFADVPYVGPMTRLDRGFDTLSNQRSDQVTFTSKILKGIGKLHRTVARGYRKTNETPVLIGETMHWLNNARDPSKPFFLFVHSDEPHAPFLPPAKYRRQFTDLSASQMYALNQDKQLFVGGKVPMTDRDFEHLRQLAWAEVAYFDAWLGRLFDWLRQRRVYDNTIIVIAADHGDNVGEHGLLRHAMCLYDTLLHVPLVLKPAAGCDAQRVKPMVQLIDVFPTLLAMAGVDEPGLMAECQSTDLMKRIEARDYPEFVISELYPPANMKMWEKKVPEFMGQFREKYDRMFRSVRTETHKLIWASRGPQELYDLVNDPGEEQNIHEDQPAVARELQQKLEDWLASFEGPDRVSSAVGDGSAGDVMTDEQVAQRLRDLGYIE